MMNCFCNSTRRIQVGTFGWSTAAEAAAVASRGEEEGMGGVGAGSRTGVLEWLRGGESTPPASTDGVEEAGGALIAVRIELMLCVGDEVRVVFEEDPADDPPPPAAEALTLDPVRDKAGAPSTG